MKKLVILAVALALALAAVLPVAAQKAPDCAAGRSMAATIMKLDLSTQQKKEMAGVLQAYQEPLGGAMDRALAARALLKQAMSQDRPDPAQVKAAYQELAAAGQAITLNLAEALPRLRAVLTPAQRELMAGARDARFDRITCLIQDGRALLRHWIQNQGI